MPSIDDVRYEVANDKAELGATAAELRDTIDARIRQAKQTIDPRTYARQYPWIALGLIVGAGFAIGRSGADKAAAAGVVEGAKKAGEAISDGASSAKDAIVERFSGSDDAGHADTLASSSTTTATWPKDPGVGSKTKAAINDLLQQGLDELLDGMGVRGRV